jgi:hypothetical protein
MNAAVHVVIRLWVVGLLVILASVATAAPKSGQKIAGKKVFPASDWEKRNYDKSTPGDFVEYRNDAGKLIEHREVVEVGDHSLVIKVTNETFGKPHTELLRYDFTLKDEKLGHGASLRSSDDKIKVAGKMRDVKLEEEVYNDKAYKRTWYLDDVPLGHMVQTGDGSGKLRMILSDYGRGK